MAIRSRDTAPRHVALLNEHTLQQTYPIAKALFGVIPFTMSVIAGAMFAAALYTFVYRVSSPAWVYIVGIIGSLILGGGQYYTRAMGMKRPYLAFIFPDALTTTWMLCQWFILDLWSVLLPGTMGQWCAALMAGIIGIFSAIIPERVWVQR